MARSWKSDKVAPRVGPAPGALPGPLALRGMLGPLWYARVLEVPPGRSRPPGASGGHRSAPLAGPALRAASPPAAPAPGLPAPVPRGPGAPPGAARPGALGPARALGGGARPVPPGLGSCAVPCALLGPRLRRSSPAPCPARPRGGPPRVPLPRPAFGGFAPRSSRPGAPGGQGPPCCGVRRPRARGVQSIGAQRIAISE